LGVSQCRWNGCGSNKLVTGESILYSGHQKEETEHTGGVAFILQDKAARVLIDWEPISERLIKAKFKSKFNNITIINAHAPTNDANQEGKDSFYKCPQTSIDKVHNRDMVIVMGDFKAKIGNETQGKELVMGREGLGSMNENGRMFTDLSNSNNLVIGDSILQHKKIHKATWISSDSKTENQIDHITMHITWRSLLDVRVMRGADAGSDHYLVKATFNIKQLTSKVPK
jgi:endonuclease/exonuclease/phosphatase family metal-dependent hydrolase